MVFPKRKHPRLKNFDYGSDGAYFITICTKNRRCLLSHIVGRGLAPADTCNITYTPLGKIAETQLLLLESRFASLTVDQYVIMPNHIHAILVINNETAGASPRPTVMDIICAYKSLTTRECKRCGFQGQLFQSSFYEHVVRGPADYSKISEYIRENPLRWQEDTLFAEE